MSQSIAAIVLAAGQGKRMKSALPKVLHPCAGMPLLAHVVKAAIARKCNPIVVVISPEGQRVRDVITAHFPKAPLKFAVQKEAKGTGDAVRAGMAALNGFAGKVMVLCGDVPLLQAPTLAKLEKAARKADVALLTAELADPTGYGRILRNGRHVVGIVEHKDATPEQRAISEVNAGIYVFDHGLLASGLKRLKQNNVQNELYLTDVVAMAAQNGGVATPVKLDDATELMGVNSRRELAMAEQALRHRLVQEFQAAGVTFADPYNVFLDVHVRIGADAFIGVGVQLYGHTSIGKNARIEGPSILKNSIVASNSVVHAFSHLENAEVGAHCSVGPYARLRPGAQLAEDAKIGNFVEVKKSKIGKGAKANHLAYIGDAEVGPGSNIGAGTITCNYDGGPVKHKTTLGKGVFIGSNSTLVAPVTLNDGSYVAAGSTINRDVPKDSLAFGRARQVNREGYARILRERRSKRK